MKALFLHILRGHVPAVELCLLVFEWANDYDHLVDADTLPEDVELTLHRAMWNVTVGMQHNAFYRAHQDELMVTFSDSISAWRIATTLQRSTSAQGHQVAHVLRWFPISFFLHCARIIGGEGWVQEVGPQFWIDMTKDHSFNQFALECGG